MQKVKKKRNVAGEMGQGLEVSGASTPYAFTASPIRRCRLCHFEETTLRFKQARAGALSC